MSRRHSAEKREINPDPKYGNLVISKFMNSIMHAGKKAVAGHGIPAGTRQRDALDRGALAPRRWRHLSGAGRGAGFAAPGARDSLDYFGRPRPQREDHD